MNDRQAMIDRGRAKFDAMLIASLGRCKDDGAANSLRDLMSDTSEEHYCAGWLMGLEYSLWAMCENGPTRWGLGHVEQGTIDELLRLSAAAGGWWVWHDGDDSNAETEDTFCSGELFVPIDEWKKMYAENVLQILPRRREPEPGAEGHGDHFRPG